MPYTIDVKDFIELSEHQIWKMNKLAHHRHYSNMTKEDYLKEQLEIVPNSEGYYFVIPAGRMHKRILI